VGRWLPYCDCFVRVEPEVNPIRPAAAVTTQQGIRQLLRYRWVVFATVSLDGALLYFHNTWGATLSGYHTAAWQLEATSLGLLAAVGFFSYALMQIPGGYLTDLLGVRRMMTIALGFLAIGTAVFAGAPTFPIAIVGRTLIGASSGVILLPSLKVLARWFRVREFATVQGIFILLSTGGSLAGTLPLALAADHWGWRLPLWTVAALTAIASALTWLLLRNDPVELALPPLDAIDPEVRPDEASWPAQRPSLRRAYQLWSSSPTLWGTSLIFFASFGSSQAFQALWAGPLLRQVRGLSVVETGGLLLLFTLGTGIGPALAGYISDRVVHGRKPVVVVSTLGQMALWILVISTFERLPLLLLNLAFLALSILGGGVLVAQVMIKDLCPPSEFGTVFGIHNGAGFYGTAALQMVTGSILNAIGPLSAATESAYSAWAYTLALSPIIGVMLVAAVMSFRLGETFGSRRNQWPSQIS
jgi:sugar phosphate permease